MTKRNPLEILLIVRQFSRRSGGRTTAAFHHAAMLSSPARRVQLVTFNHQLGYARLARDWTARIGSRAEVGVRNLYDWLADETPDDSEPAVVWTPPADARQVAQSTWERTAEACRGSSRSTSRAPRHLP